MQTILAHTQGVQSGSWNLKIADTAIDYLVHAAALFRAESRDDLQPEAQMAFDRDDRADTLIRDYQEKIALMVQEHIASGQAAGAENCTCEMGVVDPYCPQHHSDRVDAEFLGDLPDSSS